MESLNSQISIRPIPERLTNDHVSLIEKADIVVDATDSFSSKIDVSSLCKRLNKSLVWGTISGQSGYYGSTGLGSLYFHDVFRDLPPLQNKTAFASQNGVLGAACGVLGSIMCSLVLRELVEGKSRLCEGKLFYYDGINFVARMYEV